jgi:hypothetical protein
MEKRCRSELIDNLYIAAPCTVSWDSMQGDDRKRLCSGCARDVFNISDMTRREADRFLEENGTSQCMIFYRRDDGTIMTDNCPVGLRKLRDRAKLILRAASSFLALALSWTAALAQPGCDRLGRKNVKKTSASVPSPGNVYISPERPSKPPPPGFQYQGNPAGGGMILVPAVKGEGKIIDTDGKVKLQGEPISVRGRPAMVTPVTSPDKPVVKPVATTQVKLHAQESVFIDKKALESFKKGEQALASGQKSLAEFHFEKALNFFDKQPSGDAKFRALIETSLKKARGE